MGIGPCSALLERVGGDVDIFVELCDVFLDDAPKRLELIRAALATADARTLARAIRVAGKVEPIFVEDIATMPQAILDLAQDGDVVMTMGAGSIGGVPGKLAGTNA